MYPSWCTGLSRDFKVRMICLQLSVASYCKLELLNLHADLAYHTMVSFYQVNSYGELPNLNGVRVLARDFIIEGTKQRSKLSSLISQLKNRLQTVHKSNQ